MEMLDAGTSSVCVLAACLFDRRQKQALKGPQSHENGPKVVPCRFTFNSILFFISHSMFKLANFLSLSSKITSNPHFLLEIALS
jgi:hypothetical protein